MKIKSKHQRGRGSNSVSRANLTGPARNAFVYERGSGIGWSKLAGPMPFATAYKHAERLERFNNTNIKPMYCASRE
jgi:hypothetical protein